MNVLCSLHQKCSWEDKQEQLYEQCKHAAEIYLGWHKGHSTMYIALWNMFLLWRHGQTQCKQCKTFSRDPPGLTRGPRRRGASTWWSAPVHWIYTTALYCKYTAQYIEWALKLNVSLRSVALCDSAWQWHCALRCTRFWRGRKQTLLERKLQEREL